MSESSEEKTKRKYVRELLVYPWEHQTSVFFQPENTVALLPEMTRVKPLMRKAYKQQPFLMRVAKLNKGPGVNIGWVSILTLSELDGLLERLEDWIREDVGVAGREFSKEKRLRTARTILLQRPHNLQKLFGKEADEKVNRYALLNRVCLPEPDETLYQQLHMESPD